MPGEIVREPYPSDLTDEQWAVLAPYPGQWSGPGRPRRSRGRGGGWGGVGGWAKTTRSTRPRARAGATWPRSRCCSPAYACVPGRNACISTRQL